MPLQAENINYTPFHIKNWTDLHAELRSKYNTLNNVTGAVGTRTYEWTYENFGNFHSELTLLLSRFNIKVRRARFFYTAPKSQLKVHIDGTNKVGHNYWAINFPIDVPPKDHYQEWYSYQGEYEANWNGTYTDNTLLKNPENIIPISRLTLNRPYLVKVGIPHAVRNDSVMPRLILSIRFDCHSTQLMNLIKFSIEQEFALNSVHKNL
jgi:hypothetical protein